MALCLKSHCCTLVLSFFGIILIFADPTTDILALVEFYREDHKAWFAVGLTFIIVPCVAFSVIYCWNYPLDQDGTVSHTRFFVYGFNPLSPSLVRIQVFWKDFKRYWSRDTSMGTDHELRSHSEWVRFNEAVFESAPQFILQLYVMSVQQKPVQIIQTISLPISFLSLVWASTTADDLEEMGQTSMYVLTATHKLFLFASHIFLLSSRLFAISFFIVSYHWWIISVLMIHSVLIVMVDLYWLYLTVGITAYIIEIAANFWFHWLRDDASLTTGVAALDTEFKRTQLRRMLLFTNVLFVIENCTMILLFYFSPFSNTWYALPVTVCVCSFSLIGSVARVAVYRSLTKPTVHAEGPTQFSNNQRYLY